MYVSVYAHDEGVSKVRFVGTSKVAGMLCRLVLSAGGGRQNMWLLKLPAMTIEPG